ncbi:hypothetical protein ACI2JQ_16235 [Pseudomonas fulva]|uniref:hypothetical protein n=1 Tax=Pseudomonas fulva TaxID=47880 RepID=UPI00384B4076
MFNVVRSKTIPESLLAQRSYSDPDVLEALNEAFHGKCYMCETKEPLSLNVEHFQAHQGCSVKKFDWVNLYYSCGRCNNFKRHHYDDILDCADLNCDVLRLIKHTPPVTPYAKISIQAMEDDPKAVRTAELLTRIFNEDDTGNKAIVSTHLRKRVYKRFAKVIEHINVYIDDDQLPAARKLAVEHLKALMDVKQEYSAFLRWVVIDSPPLYDLLKDSINLYEVTDNP